MVEICFSWTQTDGVDSAYGDSKSYLEPLRSVWEGSEGIVWLLLVDRDRIEGGAFYLDRSPSRKHIAGPFFTGRIVHSCIVHTSM